MAIIEWQAAMNMGIDSLDEEHKHLVEIINRLHAQWDGGDADGAARKSLSEMQEYALMHFTAEEQMMEEVGYPGLELHRAQHEGFINRVREFEAGMEDGSATPANVLTYLTGWLTDHILASDRRFSRFLQDKA